MSELGSGGVKPVADLLVPYKAQKHMSARLYFPQHFFHGFVKIALPPESQGTFETLPLFKDGRSLQSVEDRVPVRVHVRQEGELLWLGLRQDDGERSSCVNDLSDLASEL